jgi:ABC-type oligopeptide transport system substrate-binding subunit
VERARAPAAQILRRSLALEPESLDPHRAESLQAGHVLRDLFEGLVAEDAGGRTIPGAAESWRIEDEGRTYVFRLRPGQRWSDGAPLGAADWVLSLRRALAPGTAARHAPLLKPIRNAEAVLAGNLPAEALGVQALGEDTLRIELERPTPSFLALLTHPIAFPVRLRRNEDGEAVRLPVGNGPFRLAERVLGSHLRLVRNPHYHDAAAVRLEEVLYLPIERSQAALARYRAGEIDWADEVPAAEAPALAAEFPGELVTLPYLGTYYFGLNLTRPPFSEPRLRRALAATMDPARIASAVLAAPEQAARAFVPPALGGERPALPSWIALSEGERLALGRRLLAEAGHGEGRPLRFELRFNSGEDHRRIALAAAALWQERLPVEVRLHQEEFRVFLENRRRRATEMFRAGWVADLPDPADFLELFRSTSPRNDTGFADPRYDRLLDQAAAEADPGRRLALLREAEAILLEEAVVIPLFHYASRRLIRPWVQGWQPNPLDRHPSRWLWIARHPGLGR